MSLALPSLSASAVLSSVASSAAAAAHWPPRRTSPRAPPSLPTTTMPSALLSLRPRTMTKTSTLARWWRLKECVLAHLRTVPVNLPQPPRCCHRAAAVALCTTTALCAATAAEWDWTKKNWREWGWAAKLNYQPCSGDPWGKKVLHKGMVM